MQPEHTLILVNMLLLFALKLTCFLLGYLTLKIGAELLREGIKGEFKFNTSLDGTKANLTSASPGLLYMLLGVGLIAYAMSIDKVIQYQSAPAVASPPSVQLPQLEQIN